MNYKENVNIKAFELSLRALASAKAIVDTLPPEKKVEFNEYYKKYVKELARELFTDFGMEVPQEFL